ncbi:MAG: DUF493 family protein [Rhodothermales bacterium]|nr:DUF493 family protein [Rhodothermales bacterium]
MLSDSGSEDEQSKAESAPEAGGRRDPAWWDNFRTLLDDQYDWPAPFTFKFIAPKERVDEISAVLGEVDLKIRASSKGTYRSVTAVVHAQSADEVIATYEAVGEIEGVVSL